MLHCMGTFSHVAVTIQGGFVTGNYWDAEIAQTGFRVACWPQTTSPSLDAPLPLRECSIVYNEIDTADFIGVQGFDAESEYWDLTDQIEIAKVCQTWITAVKGQQSNGFAWTGVKLSPISPDGKLAASSSYLSFKTPIAGTNSAGMLPPQVSIATTFKSNVPGRRGRGRMYLPAVMTGTAAVSGTVGSSARTALGNAGRALLNNVDSFALGVRYALVVTSAANPRYVLPNQVRVGDQFDTQRRRRNGVRETYTNF